MKIVSWNCQGAFREKASAIAAYMPDIAVIQECECPEKLYKGRDFPRPLTIKWFGELKSKGLCVMSYTGLEFDLHEMFNPSFEYCIPLKVKGNTTFNLLAVWTQNHIDKNVSYIGQLYKAIKFYKDYLSSDDTVIIGDFNSNQIWDKKSRIGNHSDVVRDLKDMGIVSLYHELHEEDHGSESKNTFYMYRKPDKPFHIDYCFTPEAWINRVEKFEIGDYSEWGKLSDHSPLFVEFDMDSEDQASEVFNIIDDRKSDASIHDDWMDGVEESEEYRMTSYNRAVSTGLSHKLAAHMYLKPGDKKYVE